ncbi:MAG: hypothetical protein CFE37_03895 [Alphaproteobacteria bacterium PA4]|nr:MAG: hypothetical protein CFE37_03895 [Alphaproteobacteria bacterium PA4]
MRAPLTIFCLAPLLALAACATPSQRIATALQDRGVPQAQARCMGDKLGARLSIGQLQRLNEISKLNGGRMDRMSIPEIARALNDPRDPGLVAEVIRAGVGCAF